MPKWTPGPWTVDNIDGTIHALKQQVFSSIPTRSKAERLANANVAAAAPDLYAELAGIVEAENSRWPANDVCPNWLTQARAALLKANPDRKEPA